MKRHFEMDLYLVQILQNVVVLGCFIAYMVIHGKEIMFALYIPLDILFSMSTTAFFWYNYYLDKKIKEDEERLRNRLQRRETRIQLKKSQVAEGLLPVEDEDKLNSSQDSFNSESTLQTGAFRRQSTVQLKLQKTQDERKLAQDDKFLKEIVEKDTKLGLGNDTYAMAFKAFNWEVMRELDLDMEDVHNSYHAAMFVFGFQLLMILFIGTIIAGDGFQIVLPSNVSVLGARFICTILMHLQVEGDMRQGLRMMKYVTNHPFDFANPGSAFFVALMQTTGGLAAEIACILFLGSIDKAIDVIIKFVALASIAKVDDIYAAALPADGNKIKKPTKPLVIRVHMRDWEAHAEMTHSDVPNKTQNEMDNVGWNRKIGRFMFKSLRVLYGSFIFYFLPYTSLFLPYIAQLSRT